MWSPECICSGYAFRAKFRLWLVRYIEEENTQTARELNIICLAWDFRFWLEPHLVFNSRVKKRVCFSKVLRMGFTNSLE